MSDIHTVIEIISLLAVGIMSVIGYKVHGILFNTKILERIAVLEEQMQSHRQAVQDDKRELDRRITNLEKVVYKY